MFTIFQCLYLGYHNRVKILTERERIMAKRIGIDVGGTNVKIALVDDGKIIYSNSVPTYAKWVMSTLLIILSKQLRI